MRCVLPALWFVAAATFAAEPQEVAFPSGELALRGFIYKPQGGGPFPALLYNHGSEDRPGWKPRLGDFYTGHGYVFFVPHRRGHGRSPRDGAVTAMLDRGMQTAVAVNELQLPDQLAALRWLKALSYVDADRIAVAGCSYGGIQTIFAVEANAENNLGLRAAVDFAGSAQMWGRALGLSDRMLKAVKKATVPVLFVQAENDYDLTPSHALAGALQALGKPHKVAIFPPHGGTVQQGHGFCETGSAVWGPEVLAFLAAALRK